MDTSEVSGAVDQGSAAVADAAGAGSFKGFRLRTSPTFGLGIVTDNEHGHEVLVASVTRREAAERLLAMASAGAGGATARFILNPDESTGYRLVPEGNADPLTPPYVLNKSDGCPAKLLELSGENASRLVAVAHGPDADLEKVVHRANAGYLAQAVGTLKALADWEKCVTDAGGAVLSKVENEAMRRDVEKWRSLEDAAVRVRDGSIHMTDSRLHVHVEFAQDGCERVCVVMGTQKRVSELMNAEKRADPWLRLQADIAEGRKIVTDVPAAEVEAGATGVDPRTVKTNDISLPPRAGGKKN